MFLGITSSGFSGDTDFRKHQASRCSRKGGEQRSLRRFFALACHLEVRMCEGAEGERVHVSLLAQNRLMRDALARLFYKPNDIAGWFVWIFSHPRRGDYPGESRCASHGLAGIGSV